LNSAYLVPLFSTKDPVEPDIDGLFKNYEPFIRSYKYNPCEYWYCGPTRGVDKYGVRIPHGYGIQCLVGGYYSFAHGIFENGKCKRGQKITM
jgi:hypothetical protein